MRAHKVSDKQLLDTFERLCKQIGIMSRGFNPENITAPIDGDKYDGTEQWAMKHTKRLGWMVVSGWKGSAAPLSRWNGYIKKRWNFLMMMEALICALIR